MVLTTGVPTREELVRRASELVPVLQQNAAWSEENRRIHDETIEALADAGIFRLRVPARYGGYEADTRTLVDVGTELGRGDGSTSWVASVYWIPTWMACLFPEQVQDEVFSTPDVRVCGTLSPSGMAAPVDGGVVVNGKWAFISGALHSHWQEIIAILVPPDGEPYPIMALVPISELQIVDDWYTAGLKGTGSVSTIAQDLFIPAERVVPLPAVLQGQHASAVNADSAIYRAPLLPVASASSVGTVVGLARGARDAFFARLPDRKITYTSYTTASGGSSSYSHVPIQRIARDILAVNLHALMHPNTNAELYGRVLCGLEPNSLYI